MNGDTKSEWVWPERNGPSDAEKAAEFSVGASKASHNEAMITDSSSGSSSRDAIDMGNMVNGMQNGDMAAMDFNPKLNSTYSDAEYVVEDLSCGRYAISSKLSKHKKALPKLSCDKQPADFLESDLKPIKESTMTPPSSPMLTALRDAVSSVSRIEDFEIIEEIGEGFYAKVYKVT